MAAQDINSVVQLLEMSSTTGRFRSRTVLRGTYGTLKICERYNTPAGKVRIWCRPISEGIGAVFPA